MRIDTGIQVARMLRMFTLIFVFVLTACSEQPMWLEFPIAPGMEIVEESEADPDWGVSLFLTADGEDQDRIHDYYWEHMKEPWKLCPLSEKGMDAYQEEQWGQFSTWHTSNNRLFSVRTVRDASETPGEVQVALKYSEGSQYQEMIYHVLCAPPGEVPHFLKDFDKNLGYCEEGWNRTTFDPVGWSAGDTEVRGLMAADLICRGLLVGLNRDEVIELLGLPDRDEDQLITYSVRMQGTSASRVRVEPPDSITVTCEEDWDLYLIYGDRGTGSGIRFQSIGVDKYCEMSDEFGKVMIISGIAR